MMRALLVALLAWVALLATPSTQFLAPAYAQTDTTTTLDFAQWESVSARAEEAISQALASTEALEELRQELVTWREEFDVARTANQSRINTLKSQIEALGTPDENGVEPPEVAARRAELQAQLAELEAPRRTAEEAYSHADALIREIDRIIRERQTERLLQLGPSPLNLALWPDAISDLGALWATAANEVTEAWSRPARQTTLLNNLPGIMFFLVLALISLLRGARWVEGLAQRIESESGTPKARLVAFGVSLAQLAVAILGFYALTRAATLTGLLGGNGQVLVDSLFQAGAASALGYWLASRLFPQVPVSGAFLPTRPEQAREARIYAASLGVLWALSQLTEKIVDLQQLSDATRAILHFPLIVGTGLILFRFGQMLHWSSRALQEDEDVKGNFRARLFLMTGRAAMIIAFAAPVVAAVGYLSAALYVVYPFVLTLAGLSFLIILSALFLNVYALITGKEIDAAREDLAPVLFSFATSILSLPFFALIWGARLADLTEMWARFIQGFSFGGIRISPANFLTFAIVFSIGYIMTRVLQSALKTSVLPRTRMDAGARTAIVSGIGYVGYFLAALIAISSAGIDLSSLAIVAGALSVGIGFGLQNVVSNFVSGIILLIERPIAEGDWIEVGDKSGYVREISVRSTRVETFDRTDVIIPNADLVSGVVVNYTRGNLLGRAIVPVGVSYGSDTGQVTEILKEIANAHPVVSLNPPPVVHFIGFGADSMDFEIRAILRDVNLILSVKTDINHEIVRRFREEGIEIPFPQRDVWLRNPEALRAPPAQTTSDSDKGGEKPEPDREGETP